MKRKIILLFLALVGVATMLFLDRNYRNELRAESTLELTNASEKVGDSLSHTLKAQVGAIEHLRAFMLAAPSLPEGNSLNVFAVRFVSTTPMLRSVHFISDDLSVERSYRLQGDQTLSLDSDFLLEATTKAIDTRSLTVSAPQAIEPDMLAVIVSAPLYREEQFLGAVQGVFDLQPLLTGAVGHMNPDHELQMLDNDGNVFWGSAQQTSESGRTTLAVGDGEWSIVVGWRNGPPQPDQRILFLIWGVGSVLLANALFLVNRTWTRTNWLAEAVAAKTAELSASERRYRTLVEQAADGIFILDEAGHILEVNSRGLQMLGYREDELLNMCADRLMLEEESETRSLLEMLLVGETIAEQRQLVRADGTILPTEISAKMLPDGRLLAIVRDITERLRAEQEIRRLARFPQENPSPVIRLDGAGSILYANEAGVALLQVDDEFEHQTAPDHWRALAEEALQGVSAGSVDMVCDGHTLVFEIVPFPEEGYVNFYGRDITDRILTEEALRRREATLRAVSFSAEQFLRTGAWQDQIEEVLARIGQAMSVSRVYIFENHIDANGQLYASQRSGWAAPYITTETDNDALQHIPAAAGFQPWVEVLRSGGAIHGTIDTFPEPIQTFLRHQKVLSIVLVPIFVGDLWWGCMGFDQSTYPRDWSSAEIEALQVAADTLGAAIQRERSETQVRRSAARAEALVRTASRLNGQIDQHAVLDAICEEAARMLEVPSVAISLFNEEKKQFEFAANVGLPYGFMHEAQGVPLAVLEQFTMNVELPLVLSDVQNLPPSSLSLLFKRYDFRTVAFVDLTYRGRILGILSIHVFKKTRDFSEEELLLLRGLANQAAQSIANANLFAATRGLLQRTQQQWRQIQRILDTVPDGVVLLDAGHRILLANPAGREHLSALSNAEVGDVLEDLAAQSISEILVVTGEEKTWYELSPQTVERIFMLTARPVENMAQASGWVLIIRDVSEERRRQRYLQSQERLATVGQLAAGIAHDFNNIMAIITLYSQALERNPDFPKRREYLTTISAQAKHAAELISQILDFSRRAVMERSRLDLAPFVREVVRLLRRTLPENIMVNLEVAAGEHLVYADPTRLQQILMNLALNARDAMPQGGELHIRLARIYVESKEQAPVPEMAAGHWMSLTVSDTGMGITAGHLARVFEPFFTTKGPGQGTGLGLAQVYGIVKQHGGEIRVDSQPDEGTTFTIYLPSLMVEQVSPSNGNHLSELPATSQETILLVEDHRPTQDAIRETLELMGYDVIVANTGREALELFAQHRSAIDLVLSDMVMPEMGGEDLYRSLMTERSQVKMMVMTGYPLEDEGRSLLEQGIVDWIRKPFSPDSLASKLRTVFEG